MKFVDFLVQLRMKRAEELLAETEFSIQEIARKSYANAITFGRVFKRTAGVTPRLPQAEDEAVFWYGAGS